MLCLSFPESPTHSEVAYPAMAMLPSVSFKSMLSLTLGASPAFGGSLTLSLQHPSHQVAAFPPYVRLPHWFKGHGFFLPSSILLLQVAAEVCNLSALFWSFSSNKIVLELSFESFLKYIIETEILKKGPGFPLFHEANMKGSPKFQ